MESLNYHELKREAYLMAIEKLEEEYSHDEKILKKLDIYKNKLNNGNQQGISWVSFEILIILAKYFYISKHKKCQ